MSISSEPAASLILGGRLAIVPQRSAPVGKTFLATGLRPTCGWAQTDAAVRGWSGEKMSSQAQEQE